MRNNPSLRTVDFNCCDLEAPFHILAAPCLGTSSIEKFQVTSNKSRLRSDGLDEVERWYAVCDPLNIGATWSSNYSLAEIIGGLQRELGQDVPETCPAPHGTGKGEDTALPLRGRRLQSEEIEWTRRCFRSCFLGLQGQAYETGRGIVRVSPPPRPGYIPLLSTIKEVV